MDSIKIYSSDGALLIDAVLEASSAQDWGIMSENQVSLDFYTDECIILPASCYIDYEGQRFWLLDEYKPTENNSAEWSYQVRFLGAESLLAVTVVLNQTDGSDEPIFNLTAPASQHLEFIVSNLNRRFPGMGWSVGAVPTTENIFIEYAGTYAADALQTIVGDKYEWWVDDFVINVGRCEFGSRIELGYQNGLLGGITYSTANEMRSYAYLYPIGSTRNIDPSKYGYSRLQLPDGLTRIDINPEQGLAELVESDAFADIFPRYVGKVTAVRTSSGKNEDGTSFTIYHIKDSSIPFNPNNYEIAGEVKRITFQSGELMGAEFEVNYDADNKEFEIITQFQNGGLSQLPGGALIPKVGDKYVVWNISMPDEYYPLAEQEFLQAALAFASESVKEASVYRAPVDFIEVQQRGLRLRPGQRVRLLSNEYFPDKGYYDSRITRITRDVCYPDEITIEVSSVVSKGTISRLRNSVNDSATKVASLGQSLKNYVDITSAQSIFGAKNFVNGFTIAGVKMYRHVDGYVYLDETLVLKGGVVMYGNGSGAEVPSIFDSLPIDGRTIKRDGNGALYVDETALSISGGGGGVADSVYWNNVIGKPSWIGSTKPTYKYSEIEERPDLSVYAKLTDIPSLNGYATQSWVEGKGYLLATTASSTYQSKITSSNKLAYSLISGTPTIPTMLSQLTDDVVAGNYLSMKGGTINGSITINNPTSNTTFDAAITLDAKSYGTSSYSQIRWKNGSDVSTRYGYINLKGSSYGHGSGVDIGRINGEDNAVWASITATGITATSFIGNLTGNADSATKLATARTIWGQSFDGTGNITGAMTVDGDATFSSKVVIGGISLRKVDNYLYLDSSLVLSGGVTMYGDDGTTVKPIWESIPFDRTTIDWVDGMWTVVGGVGSGGISEEFLNVKLQEYQPLLSTTNKLPYSLISGTPDLSVYFLASKFTKANIKNTLGISDWALANVKPTYTASEVGALGVNGTAQSALKMTPEYLTDLNSATTWRFFDMKTGYGSADGNKPNIAWVSGITGTVAGSSNYRWQLAATTGNARPYFRQESKGNWSNWGPLAFTSDIPTKLSQLTDDVVAGNYLSKNGGTLSGDSSDLLVINRQSSTYTAYITFKGNNSLRGRIGFDANNKPIVQDVNYGSGDFTLIHSGNIKEQRVGTADSLKGFYVESFDANECYNTTSRIRYYSGFRPNATNAPASNTWYNGLLEIPLNPNGTTAQLFFTSGKPLSYRSNITEDWKTIAFTSDIPTKLSQLTDDMVSGKYLPLTGGTINGSITAISFIGSLTGNADSATKLATPRTIWGKEFDGTVNISGSINSVNVLRYSNGGSEIYLRGSLFSSQLSDLDIGINAGISAFNGNVAIGGTTADAKLHVHGTAKFTGDTTFSSKVVIGTIPVYQSADGTLFVDANVVFRGGVAMYGNTTTTITEE